MRALPALLLFLLLSLSASAQSTFTVSGYVKDAANGETLIGAVIYDKDTKQGASSNTFGYFVLNLPPGPHTLVMTYIGY